MTDPRAMNAPTGFHDDRPLRREDLLDDPIEQFRRWLGDAEGAAIPLPNAMAVATADAEGRPSVRHVLLRGIDRRGFTFFTNYESRKGRELDANPHAALAVLWKPLQRQVRLEGPVEVLTPEESDAYFASRSRGSQLGAWASRQSEAIPDREWLEARLASVDEQYGDDVPRPPHWGGYRLVPEAIEFWEGRPNRLHDREAFTRGVDGAWHSRRLSP
jgi:pyridoxamine 5'-phosphate oxidase